LVQRTQTWLTLVEVVTWTESVDEFSTYDE
jgi:hypothetical protein